MKGVNKMNRLKELREQCNLTMKDAAKKLGIPYTTYVNYEKGYREPNSEFLIKAAKSYDVTVDYLVGNVNSPSFRSDYERVKDNENVNSNILPLPDAVKVPLIGTIACGSPILATENLEGYIDMPDHVRADFALRCKGDSMIGARIFDGDIVYIKKQDIVDDGQIAAVLIDDEATLKRVHFFPDHITLEPANPAIEPRSYWREEMNNIHILGLAVAFTSTVRY